MCQSIFTPVFWSHTTMPTKKRISSEIDQKVELSFSVAILFIHSLTSFARYLIWRPMRKNFGPVPLILSSQREFIVTPRYLHNCLVFINVSSFSMSVPLFWFSHTSKIHLVSDKNKEDASSFIHFWTIIIHRLFARQIIQSFQYLLLLHRSLISG